MRRANRIIPLLLLCFGTTYSIATEPTPDFSRGRAMLDAYLRDQVRQISDACLSDVKSRADWEAKRPELRRQFLEMIGLWPLPARTALNPVITGRIEGERFNIEKLHFQSIPGLYVTANLYIPKLTTFPAPTILYVCGHSPTVVDKVPHGNKVSYQHHPAWFAEHGYACLILDTLELGEVPGVHHGTYRFNQWWWQAAGYTPAGIECWNAMRALDYLETRPEVDRKRIGVTGRSGGGATSWWLAAADDRPQCIVPVAGIADLKAHVIEPCLPHYPRGVINGHCDCMYFVNTYRWDFAMAAALCAPRPLMLGNSDQDYIFPVSGYRRLADKVAKIYGLYGAAEKFVVLETSGPHKDTPELRLGAYRWMNQWLSQPTREMSEQARPKILPQDLKVLSSAPSGAINATVQETLVKPAQPLLPAVPEVAKEWWQGKRQELMLALQEKVFRGWPARPPALDLKLAADIQHGGVRLRAYDFVSEPGIELRLWLLTSAKVARPSVLVLEALDEPGWNEWRAGLGPEFEKAFQSPRMPLLDEAKFAQHRRAMDYHK